MNIKLKILNKILSINVYDSPSVKAWGVLNRTPDNYFLPFFDFDGVNFDVIEEEIDFLNKNFSLGPILVRKSSSFVTESGVEVGSYHVIGFSKLTLPEYEYILSRSRCDRGFKAGFRLEPERAWVLRVGEKVDLKNFRVVKPATSFYKFYYFPTHRILNRGLFDFFLALDGNEEMKKVRYNKKLKFDNIFNIFLIYYSGKREKKEVKLWRENNIQ